MDDPSPFITGTAIRFAHDSTSTSALKTCPRYYFYTMVEGWQPKSSSTHLVFGQIYHKSIEDYKRYLIQGVSTDEALRRVVRKALVDSVGMEPLKGKTRESLIRTIVWYVDRWKHDLCKTVLLPSGAPALELSFRWTSDIDIPADGFAIRPVFCGHLDEVVSYEGMNLVADRKTTGSTLGNYYFEQFSPDNQMSFYPFMANRVYGLPARGVLIDAAQVAVTFSEYSRAVAHRTPAQLDEWWTDLQWWLRQSVIYAQQSFWPMNDKACRSNGRPCAFLSICKKSPEVRQTFLEAYYVKRHWNPLAERTPHEDGLDLGD